MPDRPSSQLGLYRQSITGPDHRDYITVGRKEMLEDTMEILRKNAGKKPKHHMLFIGPRGIGKTHLLSLIEDGIASDPKLGKAYFVARFPEESNRTLSFADFLLGLCEILRDTLPDETVWRDAFEEVATEENDQIVVDRLCPLIRKRRKDTGQALVIMVENLNQIFDEQIKDPTSIAALRGFFMENNGCLLLSTAPTHFGAINDPRKPFFDFFDIQILEQLTAEETIELIRLNLEWEEHSLLENFLDLRPKILAIYQMTGGSPRLTLMHYELIANEAVTEVKRQFAILLDRITPFYQDRMNDLSPQERAVLETIAIMRRETKTPAAIAARMRMKPSQASALLGRLAKAHYLRSHENPDDKRSRIYSIREGFFDIWLAMNVSRGERVRLPFLLEFFEKFYPTIEERNRKREESRTSLDGQEGDGARLKPATLREGDVLESLDYLSGVGETPEQAKAKLKLATLHAEQGREKRAVQYPSELKTLSLDPADSMGSWIVERADGNLATDYVGELEQMIDCWQANREGQLEVFAERLQKLGEGLTYRSWSESKIAFLEDHLELIRGTSERIRIQLRLGELSHELAMWEKSELWTSRARAEAEEQGDNEMLSRALNNLAQYLKATNRLEEAEPLMRRALTIDESSYGSEHPEVAIDLNNLAQLLKATNRVEEAEPLMRRALAIHEASYGSEHPNVARDLNNLAQLLQDTNRVEEAELLMRRALTIDESSYGSEHPNVATYLNNLAKLLQAAKRLEEAEPLMRRGLGIDESSYGLEHPKVARDLNNLASLLQATNRLEETEPLMRRALVIFLRSLGRGHPNSQVVGGNYHALLKEMGRSEKQIHEQLQAVLAEAGKE